MWVVRVFGCPIQGPLLALNGGFRSDNRTVARVPGAGCPIRPDCSCINLSYPCDPCKSAVAFVLLDLPLALFIHRHAQSMSHIGTARVTFVPSETRIFLPDARWLLYTFTEDRGIPVPSPRGPGRDCPRLIDNSTSSGLAGRSPISTT